ncbi:hypothetical protein V1514DRAFT_352456 [Lipomyces japonicus]|uniref:uncharacterized protein n=1 Tax=Lipomyces japonicus TaxID=56871 RepID=UPI0034CD8420
MSFPNSTFAGSFWTKDYSTGLNVLYGKLYQGCVENAEFVHLFKSRSDAEETYGIKLVETARHSSPKPTGFGRDEGASLKKSYEGITEKLVENGEAHIKISQNIKQMVVYPFSKWAIEHERRVTYSHEDALSKVRTVEKLKNEVFKYRGIYVNKFRLVENFESEQSLAFPEPSRSVQTNENSTPFGLHKTDTLQSEITTDSSKDDEDDIKNEFLVEIGGKEFNKEQLSQFLGDALDAIPQADSRVPILGTYHNTSSGDAIVAWTIRNKHAQNLAQAEQIGQDLVDGGFLRLVGSVGSTFANSSVLKYQWRKKAFLISGKLVEEATKEINFGDYFGGLVSAATGNSSVIKDENPLQRLQKEVNFADERYKDSIKRLDLARCQLEETIFQHFKNMERYEYERLQQVKSSILVFSAAVSNVIPSMQAAVDSIMLYHETVSPAKDIRYMLESYRTGPFVPQTEVYESYFMSNNQQTFGVSLEVRAREDGKKVPFVIAAILSYLDEQYPELQDDKYRQDIWLRDVSIRNVHDLRSEINTGKPFRREILERFDTPVVAGALKLYLLELKESLVDPKLYDLIKAYYGSRSSDGDECELSKEAIIEPITKILAQLPIYNVATLDAIISHLTRLMDVTSAEEEYITKLAHEFSRLILRPRVESALTVTDRHGYRLIRDLFKYKDQIFYNLKRSTSTTSRSRAISTDESNRRLHVEERNKAVLRNRAPSPAPRGRDLSPAPSGNGYSGIPLVLTPSSRKRQTNTPNASPIIRREDGGFSSGTSHSTSPVRRGHAKSNSSMTVPIIVEPLERKLNDDDFQDGDNENVAGAKDDIAVNEGGTDYEESIASRRTSLQSRNLVGETSEEETEVEKATSRFAGVQLVDQPMDDSF